MIQHPSKALGEGPLVVGTLLALPSDFPTRQSVLATDVPADILEVRLDQMPPEVRWLEKCKSLENRGWTVLLTLRLQSEGGKWIKPDEERLPVFKEALEHLSAVDVEFASKIRDQVCQMAKNLGKACIVSHHDFQKTPPLKELQNIVSEAQQHGSIVKISTMVASDGDVQTLRDLLAGSWTVPLCVIGMGSFGTQTRVTFPTLGSYLTYGYLDKPAAPGQLPAPALVQQLRQLLPRYNEKFIAEKKALEYV